LATLFDKAQLHKVLPMLVGLSFHPHSFSRLKNDWGTGFKPSIEPMLAFIAILD
jgi:hypothetical protein